MADQIKPGGMGASNEVGMPAAFAGSMAADIESALNTLLGAEGKQQLLISDNSPDTRDRRLLFVAIAQGVMNHLRNHQGAFVIKLADNTVTSQKIDIQAAP